MLYTPDEIADVTATFIAEYQKNPAQFSGERELSSYLHSDPFREFLSREYWKEYELVLDSLLLSGYGQSLHTSNEEIKKSHKDYLDQTITFPQVLVHSLVLIGAGIGSQPEQILRDGLSETHDKIIKTGLSKVLPCIARVHLITSDRWVPEMQNAILLNPEAATKRMQKGEPPFPQKYVELVQLRNFLFDGIGILCSNLLSIQIAKKLEVNQVDFEGSEMHLTLIAHITYGLDKLDSKAEGEALEDLKDFRGWLSGWLGIDFSKPISNPFLTDRFDHLIAESH